MSVRVLEREMRKSVKDVEQAINASKILTDCKTVDPVKESCNPVCQPAISEAARRLALKVPGLFSLEDVRVSPVQQSIVDIFNDHAVIASSIIWIERYRSVIQFFIKEIPEIDYVKWRPSVEMLKEEGLIIDLKQRRHEGRPMKEDCFKSNVISSSSEQADKDGRKPVMSSLE